MLDSNQRWIEGLLVIFFTLPTLAPKSIDPLWVRLLGENRPMSADQSYEVSCEVVGARPAPIVSWWKGAEPQRNTRESGSSDGNVTISVLRLTPTLEDDGTTLACRATTPPSERNSLQDTWLLNIYHVPIVSLELVGNMSGSVIKEEMNIALHCKIQSNPWVYRIIWRHNGKTLFHNASAGTIINNQTLDLLNITRAIAGIYTCVGSNQEGDGESNAVVLDVKCNYNVTTPYEAVRVKRSPDQKSKRRRKNREAQEQLVNNIKVKKDAFLRDLTMTMLTSRKEIAMKTKDQAKSGLWREERRKRLTASNFGFVCTRKDEVSCKPAVQQIMYSRVDNEFTRHGLNTEYTALRVLRDKFGIKGRRSGVFIDEELPYLAASPDGLVGDDGIIEVKCPLRAGQFKTPLAAVRNGALPYCSASPNGSIWLKKRALYHYQIQGQLHITKRDKCHFMIYTERWVHYQVIYRDDNFWQKKMVSKLKRFYLDCLLPEIVDPRYPMRNSSDDIREADFITNAVKKAVAESSVVTRRVLGHSAASRERIMRQFENITLVMK